MALATSPPGQTSTHTFEGNTGPATPDTGRAAYCGITERGPKDRYLLVNSYSDFTRLCGGDISTSALPGQVRRHFDLGGGQCVIAVNKGVGATKASVLIPGSSGTTLKLSAANEGAWGNSLSVDRIVTGSDFQLVVYLGDDEVANTGLIATRDLVPDLFADNIIVNAEIQSGSGDPTAGTGTAFTGGTNGTTNDVSAQAALDLLGPELGTLQVSFPGDTSLTRLAQLRLHCVSGERPQRTPVFDHADASASTTAAAIRNQWNSPGVPAVHCVSSVQDGGEIVFGSTLFCAAASASDRERVPGHAIAAAKATFTGLTKLTREYTYADRLLLENAGATVMVLDQPDGRGVRSVMINSDRVGTDPEADGALIEASDLRLVCAVDAEARYEQRPFAFDPNTAETRGRMRGAVTGVGVPYFEAGVISSDPDGNGETGSFDDAFQVEVLKTGPRSTNTRVKVRPSPGVAFQTLNIVRQEG